MVVQAGVLFDTVVLVASVLDAQNTNCMATVTVTWTEVLNASYQLERRISGGAWAGVYTGSALSYAESLGAGVYEYRVKVTKGSKSVYSNTDSVTVKTQGAQIRTFCVGYDLWEEYVSGCNSATRLIQALSPSCGVVWGCTDPTAQNYNPNATHSNGSCTWASTSCNETTTPFWVQDGATTYTVTHTLQCPAQGSGTLTGFSYWGFAGGENLTHWIVLESYSYTGNVVTIKFHTPLPENKWFYAQFSWTGVQRLS